MRRRACLGLLLALPLAACISSPAQLAKTDIDRVAEAHRREILGSLRLLAGKLYRRNPREWRKGGHESLDAAVARIFDAVLAWRLPELEGRRGTEALLLAFREDFGGDRVAAFIGGLGDMLHTAFDGKTEFFVIDDLDPQKLHNSARNVEIAVWKLSSARDASGVPLLLSNEAGNLSFEREFGKIIGSLDTLTRIIADKTNRTVVKVIQTMATAVFLPVGL